MYRNRYKFWLCLVAGIVIVSIVLGFNAFYCSQFNMQECSIYVNSNINPILNDKLAGTIITDNTILKTVSNVKQSPDFIIVESNENDEYSGYTKFPMEFVSPLIVFAPASVLETSSGFTLKHIGEKVFVIKDLNPVLIGLIGGNTWAEVGIADNKNRPITVVVPLESSPLFPYVRDMFVKTIGEENADKALEKCIKVEDVYQYIYNNKDDAFLAITPEFSIGSLGKENDVVYTGEWVSVYPNITTGIYWDLYVKQTFIQENKFYSAKECVEEYFRNNVKFVRYTNVRDNFRTFAIKNNITGSEIYSLNDINMYPLGVTN